MVVNFEPHEGPRSTRCREDSRSDAQCKLKTIPQSWHFSFFPECSLPGKIVIGLGGEENICSDWKLRDRDNVHHALVNQIVPFLVENLK